MLEVEGVREPIVVGRYALYGEIASGGMAAVHYGRLQGAAGFSRMVAVKRLHPQFAKDPEFATQFLDEARLAARIQHPNVVQTLDVVAHEGELLLVLEYIAGETLSRIARGFAARSARIPLPVATGIVCGALHGLHAAHEARDDAGNPLEIVHRDVSPQNIILGRDGVPRVLDFGVAKAAQRAQSTEGHQIKGKVRYMAPEQVMGHEVDRRTDVFAAGVILWELVTGERLFGDSKEMIAILRSVISMPIPRARDRCADVPPAIDAVIARALRRNPSERYPTAQDLALALEAAVKTPSARELSCFLEAESGAVLAQRVQEIARIAQHASTTPLGIRTSFVDVVVDASALVEISDSEHDDAECGTERVTGGGWLSKQDDTAGPATAEPAAEPTGMPAPPPRPRSRRAYFAIGALIAGAALIGTAAMGRVPLGLSRAAGSGVTQATPSVRDVIGAPAEPEPAKPAVAASALPPADAPALAPPTAAAAGDTSRPAVSPPRPSPRAPAGTRLGGGDGRPKVPPTRPAVVDDDPLSRRK